MSRWTGRKELIDPKDKYSCQNPCNGVGIPYKLFMQMQDLQVAAFDARVSKADGTGGMKEDAALVNFQEEIGWPWRASQAQLDEWNAWMENAGM